MGENKKEILFHWNISFLFICPVVRGKKKRKKKAPVRLKENKKTTRPNLFGSNKRKDKGSFLDQLKRWNEEEKKHKKEQEPNEDEALRNGNNGNKKEKFRFLFIFF